MTWYAVGTRVYAQRGTEPALTDRIIAACCNELTAQQIVDAHNPNARLTPKPDIPARDRLARHN